MANISPISTVSLTTLGSGTRSAVKMVDAKNERKRFWFQNQDAAVNAFLNVTDPQGDTVGFKVPPGQSFVDDPPCPHLGQWWVITDGAVTGQLVFAETV